MGTFTALGGVFASLSREKGLMVTSCVRSLAFPVAELPTPLLGLLGEFRLIVNKSIRIALREDIRSCFRLSEAAYAGLSAGHDG
jgi:hypothetical protein